VVTEAPSPRALPASRLAAFVPGAVVEPDPERALARARELAGRDGLVVAFGSLFLVGDLRARLTGEARDPVPLSDPGKLRAP
jgi:dihydrofolate synthase/folylpolyglutamate synthase